MAIEFSFVETDTQKIYDEVINALMDSVNEPLYPGDERRIYGEALVMVLVSLYNDMNDAARQRTLQYARGPVLDAIGERVNTSRLMPTPAHDVFRFTVSAPQTNNIIIPQGTRITADGTFYFTTDDISVLQAGETYVDIQATCTVAGSTYNGFPAGSISTLVDLIPYIESVKNLNGTSGGDDGEPYTTEGDDRFRERIRLAPASFSVAGPESAYEYHALSADPDIIDVGIDSPSANIIDIYAIMKGGEVPDPETLQKIEDAVNPDDVRPMCDVVTAKAPEQVEYDIEIKYYCTLEGEADAINLIEGEGGALDQYNAWQVSKLGRSINPSQLLRYAMQTVDGEVVILRVDIVKPTHVSLNKKQVAKFSGTLNVTHEVIKDE